jgi:suppressor for copper-sensitivity B
VSRPRRLPAAALAALAALAVLLPAPAALAVSGEWRRNEQSKVRLITPWTLAPTGGELTAGLELETIPGWHVYWKNSGDAGYPPAVGFEATPRVAASEILWPAPERYHLPGDLVALGYEGQVVYPLRLELDAEPGSTLTLVADLDYLVCEVDCIPYTYRLEVEQPFAAAGAAPAEDPATAALLARWWNRVPRPADAVAGVESDGVLDLSDPERPALEVRFAGVVPAAGAEPALFLEESDLFATGTPELASDGPVDGEMKGGGPPVLRFRVPLSFRARPETLPREAELAWTLTGVETPAGGAVPLEARRTVPVRTEPVGPAPEALPPARGLGEMLLWAFLGGLLLHLTPTVLPLAVGRLVEIGSSTADANGSARESEAGGAAASSMVEANGSTREAGVVRRAGVRRVRRAALASVAGVLLAAALLPFVPLGGAGGWGAQLQAPVPVAALALFATLVALNLWGLLGLPLRRPMSERGSAGTSPLSPRDFGPDRFDGPAQLGRGVLTGVLLLVLGLAWNLPPLARSLGPALAGAGVSAAAALLVALALGLGLALPFLAAAAAPAVISRLSPPTPAGRGRLAEALGFVEAGALLWLLYLLSRQVSGEGLAFVQLALLGVGMVAWLRHATRRRWRRAVLAALLAVLAAAVPWLAGGHRLGGGSAAAQKPSSQDSVSSLEQVDSTDLV